MTLAASLARRNDEAPGSQPLYGTALGAAYVADSRRAMESLPTGSVNLIVTSPPYALQFRKAYGNVDKGEYVGWFAPFAREMLRILADDGSLILNMGGSYNKGTPTRSLYHYKLLISLVEEIGFHLAQECFWYNPAKMPMPAEWVTVRRIRVKDSVEYVWWLSKTPWPKATNRNVLTAFSADMRRLMERGQKEATRPGGHKVNPGWADLTAKGAIPSNFLQAAISEEDEAIAENVLMMGNNAANDTYSRRCKAHGMDIHPARFPRTLPEFFIKMLTGEGDLVLDPFAGSNTTGAVAEALGRRWIAYEEVEAYLDASRFRFGSGERSL